MSEPKLVKILHTNDFHNHLSAGLAVHIKERRQLVGEDSLLLDSGDAISAGNVGVRIGGEPILETMNVIGYDAMTMGNREFHVADGLLRLKIANAKFPILCANMRYQKVTDDLLPLSPFFSKTLSNGLRVAVIGVTVPMVTSRMTARVISSYLFDDPVNIVSDWVGKLRIDHDVLIALTHIGLKEDQRLAAACPDLDLIIGGHSHAVLSTPQFIEGVPVVQAGWFGHYVGEVLLTVDGTGVRLTQSSLEDVKSFGGRIAT